jgi:alkylhydroperoxidase family enzyme
VSSAIAARLNATGQVELAAVVAGYNMVARFLLALQVPPEH